MNRLGSLFIAMLAATAFVEVTTGQSTHTDPQRVAREVANLSDEKWTVRRDAVEWLIHSGAGTEMPLRRLVANTQNDEARMWAQRVLERIGPIRRIEPTMVSLSLDHVDVRTAFEWIADIEGAELPTDPPDLLAHCDGTLTAQYKGQTYWQAMLDLCRQANLELHSGPRGIVLARAEHGTVSRDSIECSGAFLICGRLIRWSRDPGDMGRSVRIELHAEPRAQVLRGDWRVALAEATDQCGQSLRPLAQSGMDMGGAQTIFDGCSWSVPLRPAATADTRLTRLRGSAEVLLAAQVISGQAPDHAGDRTLGGPMPIHLACGGVSASVLRVVRDDAAWIMEMQVDVDAAEVEWDAVMQAMGEGGLRAFDPDDHEFKLASFSPAGGGPSNQVRCRWTRNSDAERPVPGDPFKLVWRLPGKTVRVPVPFNLSDVRLAP
jgi:hypothetical protein